MTTTQLIGISGYKRAGKDAFAAALVEGRDYRQESYAQPLRDMLYAQNPQLENGLPLQTAFDSVGYEKLKDISAEYRRLLQALGTEAGRKILGENIWVDTAMRKVDGLIPGSMKPKTKVVFADVRFHNEAQAIVNRGGVIVRIERTDNEVPDDAHESETSMDDWSFDYVVRNDSTLAELRQKAFDLADKLDEKFTQEQFIEAAARSMRARHTEAKGYFRPRALRDGPYTSDGLMGGTSTFTVDL